MLIVARLFLSDTKQKEKKEGSANIWPQAIKQCKPRMQDRRENGSLFRRFWPLLSNF